MQINMQFSDYFSVENITNFISIAINEIEMFL